MRVKTIRALEARIAELERYEHWHKVRARTERQLARETREDIDTLKAKLRGAR